MTESANVRDLQRLFFGATAMLASGMSRDEVVGLLVDGVRVCFPPRLGDDDPRGWVMCLTCEDTGWFPSRVRPRLYGGVEVGQVRPCDCARGRGKQVALDALADRPAARRRGALSHVAQRGTR